MAAKVKAIAVDIDGTLTDDSKRVSCAATEALRRQVDNGIVVMVVTGNVLPIAYALRQYLGFNGPVIAENGGIVSREEEVHYLGSKTEPQKAFDQLSKFMKVERLFSDRWRETEVALKPKYDIEQVRKFTRGFDVKVFTTGWAIHITQKDTDKENGLAYVCKNWLKLSIDDVAAIGDSDNDINMITKAGYGITLSNGSQNCKDRADYVASKPHGDGVVEALKWLGLEP